MTVSFLEGPLAVVLAADPSVELPPVGVMSPDASARYDLRVVIRAFTESRTNCPVREQTLRPSPEVAEREDAECPPEREAFGICLIGISPPSRERVGTSAVTSCESGGH